MERYTWERMLMLGLVSAYDAPPDEIICHKRVHNYDGTKSYHIEYYRSVLLENFGGYGRFEIIYELHKIVPILPHDEFLRKIDAYHQDSLKMVNRRASAIMETLK